MALSIEEANALSDADFLAHFADVAEHSPWVAARACALRPFINRDAMLAAFSSAIAAAPRDMCLALIRAHPDLAGKAALAGRVANESMREQKGAGLDTLTPTEFARFTDLNTRYNNRFGFPFIFAVKGATKHQILDAFALRIDNSPEAEFDMALAQIARIFRFRIEDRVLPG
jgi:2-oxo-4-hydroxy-4-carboxy-5-ureidoimidazoline decarboxylase